MPDQFVTVRQLAALYPMDDYANLEKAWWTLLQRWRDRGDLQMDVHCRRVSGKPREMEYALPEVLALAFRWNSPFTDCFRQRYHRQATEKVA